MRRKFASELYDIMKSDNKVNLITADMGYLMYDQIKNDMPNQFYNVGAAEQVMMDMAIGMTMMDKIAVTYSITPFLLFRAFESIRNYIDHESIPVIMVGSGRGDDYKDGGFSHYGGDDIIIKQFKNIVFLSPEEFDLKSIIYSKKPTYLNLKR